MTKNQVIFIHLFANCPVSPRREAETKNQPEKNFFAFIYKTTCKKHFYRVTYMCVYYKNEIMKGFFGRIMERKTVSQAQIYVRDAVNRSAQQAGMKDFTGAVKTLLPVIKRNLDIPLLFEKIREYEINKLKNQASSAKFSAGLSALFTVPVIQIIMMFDPLKAMRKQPCFLRRFAGNAQSPCRRLRKS